MKILLQRVSSAEVSVDQIVIGNINMGIVAFIGIEIEDTVQIMQKMMEKLINLRIFPKENGHFDKSLIDIKEFINCIAVYINGKLQKEGAQVLN